MITIPLELPNDLARRVMPFQDRLAEIIELGLLQIEMSGKSEAGYPQTKQQVLDALASTGIVTLPTPGARRKARRSSHADQGWRAGCESDDHCGTPWKL